MENEHFRGGTMDNIDGAMDNAGGTMYIQNHVKLKNMNNVGENVNHKNYLWTTNHLVSIAYMVSRWCNHEQCVWNLKQS